VNEGKDPPPARHEAPREEPLDERARERVSRAAFLRGRAPEGPITFRVEAPGPGRAFATGRHARVSYLELDVPAALRPSLTELARAVSESTGVEDAARRLEHLLVAVGLEVDRRDEPARSVRRHPAGRLAPRAERPLVDAELLGLAIGARSLAKRMCPPGGAADRVERLRAQGFEVERFGVTSHGTASPTLREVILVAREQAALREGRAVEEALVAAADRGDDDLGAVRAMGAMLGYPACCVARFTTLRARDDGSLAGALLPRVGERTPFETAFTIPPFSLVSHAPCAPSCAATLTLVQALEGAMPAEARAFRRDLADGRWAVDARGWLVRERAGVAAVRIDLADPELRELPAGPLEEDELHWRIETFSAGPGLGPG
jgi:hypothetical protein